MKYVKLLVSQAIIGCSLATLAHGQAPRLMDEMRLDQLIEAGLFHEYGESMPKYSATTDQRIHFQKKTARSGDTGLGVEVAKTNNVVAIDVTPCAEFKTVLRFGNPFKETKMGIIRCASGYHQQVKVTQE
jgi:hypothetical protein